VAADRPHVVVHVAVSLDGATTGFDPDVARFYELIETWKEDVTLAGADTILAQEEALANAELPGPTADAPALAVVDGRGRVSAWEALRDCGHWSDVVALRCETTPADARAAPRQLVVGGDRVDLAAALTALARGGARVVRVDSGGGLNGALLKQGLVDELSLLVHPVLAGESGRPWHGRLAPPAGALELIASNEPGGGLVWIRYGLSAAR
jgi:2,5-diamino-6-(ribosylamino)-4(3H)-pyrimidinone 5'-phosphate reductase